MNKRLLSIPLLSTTRGRFVNLVALCFALFLPVLSFSQRQLLGDLNQEVMQGYIPYNDLKSNTGRIFFIKGNQLFVTEGSPISTRLVRQFEQVGPITMVANIALFAANDGESGKELWRSDGTDGGTYRIKDIYEGIGGSEPQHITMHSLSLIYFTAYTPTYGRELWRTDGTEMGTVMVKDILRVKGNSNPNYLTKVGSLLYFSANNGQNGIELWKTNGTEAGTVMVKDIQEGPGGSGNPKYLTNVNGTLYFTAMHAGMGWELWKTTGSAASTVVVKDIAPGHYGADIDNMINVNGTLFFTANDRVHGDELWKSNGTEAGTVMVKDLNPGAGGSNSASVFGYPMGDFANMNGVLFFRASQGYDQNFYVRSDGTEAGTYKVADANAFGFNEPDPEFTYLNGFVFFLNIDFSNDSYLGENKLYRMNLDGSGVTPLATFEVPEDYYDTFNQLMVRYGSSLILTVMKGRGWAVVKSTQSGTITVLNQAKTPTVNSSPSNFVQLGNQMFFITEEGGYLYRTDGTPDGTFEVAQVDYFAKLVKSGNNIFYNFDNHLYKVDASGNVQEVYNSGNYIHKVTQLCDVNGVLYFHNGNGELWKTSGTLESTVRVRVLNFIEQISNVGGKAFVLNRTSTGGIELWRTNATGLLRVKTISTSFANQAYYYPTASVGSVYYFIANDGSHGNELWRSDGTEFGTFMMSDLNMTDSTQHDGLEADIRSFTVFNNKLYFSATGADNKWRYYYVSGRSSIAEVGLIPPVVDAMSIDGQLYLFAQKSVTDTKVHLWSTIGTTGSLEYMTEIGYGRVYHTIVNGNLYFNKEAGELMQIAQCGIGVTSVDIGEPNMYAIAAFGNHLIYAGYDFEIGIEPFIYYNLPDAGSECENPEARIASEDNESEFTPWPNPYTAEFTMHIKGKQHEYADVSVYNASGYLVETYREISANTDYPNLGASWPKGLYYVKVMKAGKLTTHRLIKK